MLFRFPSPSRMSPLILCSLNVLWALPIATSLTPTSLLEMLLLDALSSQWRNFLWMYLLFSKMANQPFLRTFPWACLIRTSFFCQTLSPFRSIIFLSRTNQHLKMKSWLEHWPFASLESLISTTAWRHWRSSRERLKMQLTTSSPSRSEIYLLKMSQLLTNFHYDWPELSNS